MGRTPTCSPSTHIVPAVTGLTILWPEMRRAIHRVARGAVGYPVVEGTAAAGTTPGAGTHREEVEMGLDDKIDNKAQEMAGKAKEGAGKATDDRSLEAEGKKDQVAGSLKQAGEKVKDAFKK
ncbi:hypothetical protein PSU4_16320 [Pseudonocardia sulfidoxydans NBRC 16205]|uniref:CsbD-like domain-containing protein n=2 Tax=Pseudonocardia sulfidoxydans TaxID=54011 RepID=A0A511DI48_9PSEU|nr:hypothetical protein PSU4_16320 [Pseudonocardia sulfidoxydans NBRC 16205]